MIADGPENQAVAAAVRSRQVPRWASDGGALLALVLLSFAVGCLVNAFRTRPVPWRYASRAKTLEAAVADLSAGAAGQDAPVPVREIRLEEFQPFVMGHQGLVLDARPKAFYDLSHVPGAVNLPRATFADEYPRLRQKIEGYKTKPVAVYCSGADCTDSQLVADALAKLGFQHLMIYTSGWNEWSQTGLPQEGTAAQP